MISGKKRIVALLIDGSADIPLGIIAASLMSYLWTETLSWRAVFVGIGGALAPDLDGLYFFATRGVREAKNLYMHRSGLHYPLLYLPCVALIIALASQMSSIHQGALVTAIFVSASFLHFVHDTFLHGWGIPWLYPFYRWRIALFHIAKTGQSLPKIFIFPIEDVGLVREKYRDQAWYEFLYRFPPHPWTYVIATAHMFGLVLIFL